MWELFVKPADRLAIAELRRYIKNVIVETKKNFFCAKFKKI